MKKIISTALLAVLLSAGPVSADSLKIPLAQRTPAKQPVAAPASDIVSSPAISELRPYINGIVVYGDDWTSTTTPSLQSFRVSYTPTFTKTMDVNDYNGFAGDYVDGKYRYIGFSVNSQGGISAVDYNIVDLESRTVETIAQTEALGACMDMTYDNTTGKMFGLSGVTDALVEIDLTTGNASFVAQIPSNLYTISADAGGQLYGIGFNTATGEGELYRINKSSGEVSLVGSTGVSLYRSGNNTLLQSATFNHADGTLWWCTTTSELNGVGALFEIDVTTGKAFQRCTFPNNEQVTGIFIIPEAINPEAPGAVTQATATPDTDAKLSGTIAFTAPSVTASGDELSSLTGISIYKGSAKESIHIIENPTPGESYSWTDNNATAGFNAYRIVASNEAGTSAPVYTSMYCGYDYPSAVSDFTVTIGEDGYPVLTWTAPVTGINGGLIDPAKLTYDIARNIGTVTETIATDITATTFTDKTISIDAPEYPYYYVTAVSPTGRGLQSHANGVHVGPAYGLPYIESFADQNTSTKPWILQSLANGGLWSIGYINTFPGTGPVDEDYGMAIFDGFRSVTDAEARLGSPIISLENASDPVLSFYFYYYQLEDMRPNDRLFIDIATDGGDYEPIPGAVFTQHDKNTGWTECVVSLKEYAGQKRISLGFRGVAGDAGNGTGGFDLCIDRIRVTDGYSGIDRVTTDTDADPIYYNLQGQRVATPVPGQIYIVSRGSAVTKEVVR